jgi:low affinity Fe/Cu permease
MLKDTFRRFAARTAEIVGSSWAFMLAVAILVVWALTGPAFKFSDTWQLIINTGTTIVTFLMVFLIQNTQNRDAKAIHLKLDELIRSVKDARNELIDLEDLPDEELRRLQVAFERMRERSRRGGEGEVAELQQEAGEVLDRVAHDCDDEQPGRDRPQANRRAA